MIRSTKRIGDKHEYVVIPHRLDMTSRENPGEEVDEVHCLTIEECLATDSTQDYENTHGIDIVITTFEKQIIILNFSPAKRTVTQLCQHWMEELPLPPIKVSYSRPYLALIDEDYELNLYSYHTSTSSPEKKIYDRPLLITHLEYNQSYAGEQSLSITRNQSDSTADDANRFTYVVAIVREGTSIHSQGYVNMQELHIDPRTHKVFLSRVATCDDVNTNPLRRSRFDYAACTSISYRYPVRFLLRVLFQSFLSSVAPFVFPFFKTVCKEDPLN